MKIYPIVEVADWTLVFDLISNKQNAGVYTIKDLITTLQYAKRRF